MLKSTSIAVVLLAATVAVPADPLLAGGGKQALDGDTCAALMALGVDRQANVRAALLRARCGMPDAAIPDAPVVGGGLERPFLVAPPASEGTRILQIGGTDVNTITGTETFPAVTQSESFVWGNGNTIVVTINDSRTAPSNYSGVSTSTDGGATFTRLNPSPFASGHGTNYGDPNGVWNARLGSWYAAFLATGCGGQGLGVWTSPDGLTWSTGACAHSGSSDDRNSMWVDNNPGSPYYGRMYISWNDFAASQGIFVARSDNGTAWTTVQVVPTFIRNVQMTGSWGTDGTVFIAGMNEGGGGTSPRTNIMYRSTDGGVTWGSVTMGASFAGPGNVSCGYFRAVTPIWRHMGWGQPGVGPNGVVHYAYCQHGTDPSDEGDIMYQRSSDNGLTWSSPIKLNTDTGIRSQWMPSLAVTNTGNVVVSWYDRRNAGTSTDLEFWGRISLDNGLTWQADDRISDVLAAHPQQPDPNVQSCYAGDYNYHSALGTDALVTWTDGRVAVSGTPQQDVFFDKIALCNVSLTPSSLPNGTIGVPYNQTLTASGGTGPYTYAVTSGALPPGLTLGGASGVISGTPSTLGTFAFTVTATDQLGCTASVTYLVSIAPASCGAISVSPAALPNADVGVAYSQTLTASGGTAPYTFVVSLGSLPAGLTLSPAGVISGTPTASGTSTFTITATDSIGCPGNASYSLVVCQLTMAPASLPGGAIGAAYSQAVTTTGGATPYTYAVTGGSLPPGLTLSPAGLISGNPTAGGAFPVDITSTDANACAVTVSYTISIGILSATCSSPALPIPDNTTVTDTMTVTTTGNVIDLNVRIDVSHTYVGDLRFTVAKVTPPTSAIVIDRPTNGSGGCSTDNILVTLDDEASTAVQAQCNPAPPAISGTHSPANPLGPFDGLAAPGAWTLSVSDLATIDVGTLNQWCLDIVLPCPTITISPGTLPGGSVGVAYSQTLTASGGTAPYTYAVTSGTLPPGLSLDLNTGVLSGTPTAGGTYAFNVTATDSGTCSGTQAYSIAITCTGITLSPATLPGGTVGVAYSQTITASGGTAPYTYAVTAGSLPAGLSLDLNTGVLSGVPTAVGTSSFDITATDAGGCTGSRSYQITIGSACNVTVTPATIPDGVQGLPYSQALAGSGGTAPYTFAVTSGSLPPGITLSSAGLLSGTPTTPGAFAFTVTATDSLACAGSRAYTMAVLPAVDFLVGEGLGPTNGNGVRIYKRDHTAATPFFQAYGAGAWGTNVAAGDINGAFYGEILTGPGPGAVYGPQVRGFLRDGTAIAKVSFYAYGTLRYGVNVGSGDFDADGFAELLTGAGPGEVFGPHVRGWNFDNTGLSTIAKINFFAYNTLKYGVNVEDGNVDGDAWAEILTAPGPGAVFSSNVRAFNFDNMAVTLIQKVNFNAFATLVYGANTAGGDVDDDGFSEIAVTPGPGPTNASRFLGFNYDGGSLQPVAGYDVTPFTTTLFGGRVGLADLYSEGRWDLVAGAGRDPAATSEVRRYDWSGTALGLQGSFIPFNQAGYGYGVNVTGGAHGYY